VQPFTPQSLPLTEIAWEPLIPLIGRANRSIAQYDGVLYGVPNPEVLLSPLTTQEAVLSSRIEGTQATLGEVLKFEAGEEPNQEARRLDIQEILNYRRALREAETELRTRPFNLNLLLKLHEILLDSVRGRNMGRGRFRTTQNWIGAQGSPIEEAQFIPPEPSRLMEYLDNWEEYYHADRPDELVQLAVVHAQFEIIHPFCDGNGRLGRILIPLFLYEKKLLRRPMFYLSIWIESNRDQYVALLRELGNSENSWNRWIEFFLTGIDDQARKNAEKARSIMDLYERMKQQVIDVTRSQFAVPLLDQIFERPIFQSTHLRFQGLNISRQSVAHLLTTLRSAEILKVVRQGVGRRPTVYVFPELLNLCEGREVF
jgi:cell filamentation protein, protein adenylyltransferase